jgi:hypothetical protein
MIFRRIRHHVETHDWFAVAIDLLFVFVGVFLGFQATNWNDRRIEHDQGVSYRMRLIDELDFNAGQFAKQRAYYEQVRSHAVATMTALEAPASAQGRDFLIHAYQSTQVWLTPGKRFIYDDMVSSGLVERLGSESLQAHASDYYLSIASIQDTYGEIPPYRLLMRTLIPHTLQAQIRGRCGDIRVIDQGRIINWRLPDKCDVSLEPVIVAAGVARIRREARLHDELNRYLSWLDEQIGSLEVLHERTISLRKALES